jgi:hypothetical protein
MSTANQYSLQLEAGLRELTKLIKAVQYYPAGHPSLKSAVQDARSAFLPLIEQEQNLICLVRKEGFFLDDRPVGPQNQILQKLAPFLFSRRVQSLTLLPDLTLADLNVFARSLTIEPAST